jgi:hypothetical protein
VILDAIDQWIIDRFQWVVDLTQRTPQWWVGVMSVLYCLSGPFRAAFGDLGWFTGGAIFLIGVVLYWIHTSPGWVAHLASAYFFRISLTFMMLGFWIGGVLAKNFSVPSFITDVALISIYYFACCKPPKPRKKTQTKLALNT